MVYGWYGGEIIIGEGDEVGDVVGVIREFLYFGKERELF